MVRTRRLAGPEPAEHRKYSRFIDRLLFFPSDNFLPLVVSVATSGASVAESATKSVDEMTIPELKAELGKVGYILVVRLPSYLIIYLPQSHSETSSLTTGERRLI